MIWKQESLYVKRNEHGVIIDIREEAPAGYVAQQNDELVNEKDEVKK